MENFDQLGRGAERFLQGYLVVVDELMELSPLFEGGVVLRIHGPVDANPQFQKVFGSGRVRIHEGHLHCS